MKLSGMRTVCIGVAVALACAAPAPAVETVESDQAEVRFDVDLSQKGATLKRPLKGLATGAKKLFARYNDLALGQALLTITRSDDKEKDLVWYLCKNPQGNLIVFVTHNFTDEPKTIVFRVGTKNPLTPIYRRVYSENGGKTWKRIAFEPPHSSISGCPQTMPEPYTIEIPPHSHQTATVRLK